MEAIDAAHEEVARAELRRAFRTGVVMTPLHATRVLSARAKYADRIGGQIAHVDIDFAVHADGGERITTLRLFLPAAVMLKDMLDLALADAARTHRRALPRHKGATHE